MRPSRVEEVGDRRVVPLRLDVGGEARDQRQVRPLAERLVGDRRPVALGVAGARSDRARRGRFVVRRRRRRALHLVDLGDEPVAAAVVGPDRPLVAAGVADGAGAPA